MPEHVRGDAEGDVVLFGHRGHVAERLAHDVLEPLVDLLLAPEEPGAVLHPLEVGHRDAAGVREDVGHDEDPLLVEDLVGALRRRAVRAFDDDLRPDVSGVSSADLVLVRRGDEDVALELEELFVADLLDARDSLERLPFVVVGKRAGMSRPCSVVRCRR